MNSYRRQFLRALGALSAALTGAGAGTRVADAQPSSHGPLQTTDLGDGMVLVTGAGGNIVVLTQPEGLVLVDSGSPESTADLRALIGRRFADAPVAALFNTHWHLDHTGGNEHIVHSETEIIAHENTRLWMGTGFYVEWEDRRYQRRVPAALPNKTFFSSDPQPLELTVGGERIVYGHLREAHTDGDIYVAFPERDLIVAGGTVTAGSYPVMDYITGGWIGGMTEANQLLIDMCDSSTRIVPAAGAVRTRSDLERQKQMLETVRERIEAMALVGKGIDEMILAGITEEFDAEYGNNADLFISNIYQGLWWGNRLRGIVA